MGKAPEHIARRFSVKIIETYTVRKQLFLIIMNIKVIIPRLCEHTEPDMEMGRFRIQVKLGIAYGFRKDAQFPHSIQCLKLRHTEKGILKPVNLFAQILRCRFFSAGKPGGLPSVTIIVRAGIGSLTVGSSDFVLLRIILILKNIHKGTCCGKNRIFAFL